MILQPRCPDLLLIRQTDHAALSGALAEHWGNADFAALAPRESMVRAAARGRLRRPLSGPYLTLSRGPCGRESAALRVRRLY